MRNWLYLLLAIVALSGCAAIEKGGTTFEPLRTENESQIYRYKALAGVNSPEQSADAEALRIEILQLWLKDNELASRPYQILSREVVLVSNSLLGPVHAIYYTIKVPKGP